MSHDALPDQVFLVVHLCRIRSNTAPVRSNTAPEGRGRMVLRSLRDAPYRLDPAKGLTGNYYSVKVAAGTLEQWAGNQVVPRNPGGYLHRKSAKRRSGRREPAHGSSFSRIVLVSVGSTGMI